MVFHVFGASTPSGASFIEQAKDDVVVYSRNPSSFNSPSHYVDLSHPDGFDPSCFLSSPSVLISFAPIWLLAPFFAYLSRHYPDRLSGIRAVVACSSSSTVTKRFSSNTYDQLLVKNLCSAENQLLDVCSSLSIPCQIIRPTLIYGQVGEYVDSNVSFLLKLLRLLPVLPVPTRSGKRQPLHAIQLASVVLSLANRLSSIGVECHFEHLIEIGGDTTLSYRDMLHHLQLSQPVDSPARCCFLLEVPNRLYFFVAAPLILLSPKSFDAVLRISSNLSGFTPSNRILGSSPRPFPAYPVF